MADNPLTGQACFMDGEAGTLKIDKTDKEAPDFRSKGRLQYDGARYLKHAGNDQIFLKGGADSPENFLGYREFDGTYYGGNNNTRSGEAVPNSGLHLYEPHIKDWKTGDPQWKNGKGKGIIGALNYLSSRNEQLLFPDSKYSRRRRGFLAITRVRTPCSSRSGGRAHEAEFPAATRRWPPSGTAAIDIDWSNLLISKRFRQ